MTMNTEHNMSTLSHAFSIMQDSNCKILCVIGQDNLGEILIHGNEDLREDAIQAILHVAENIKAKRITVVKGNNPFPQDESEKV